MQSEPLNQVGDRIRKIRGDTSMEEFAEQIGAHRNTLGNYERGTREVSASVLTALHDLGWNISWILTGEGPERLRSGTSEERNSYHTQLVGRASAATIAGLQEVGMPAHEPERWHFFRRRQDNGDHREDFQVIDYVALRMEYLRQLGVMPAHALLLLQGDDALAPALRRGDLIIVDSSDTDPLVGNQPALYCIRPDNPAAPLAARYLVTTPPPHVHLARHSPHPDAPVDRAYTEAATIIGRVTWHARIIPR